MAIGRKILPLQATSCTDQRLTEGNPRTATIEDLHRDTTTYFTVAIYNVASLETQPSQERVQTRNPCGNIAIPDCQRSCSSRGVCRWTADVNVLFPIFFRFEHDRNNSIGRCQHAHPGSRLTKLFFGPVFPPKRAPR